MQQRQENERREIRKFEIMTKSKAFRGFKQKDDYRDPDAGYYGGF